MDELERLITQYRLLIWGEETQEQVALLAILSQILQELRRIDRKAG